MIAIVNNTSMLNRVKGFLTHDIWPFAQQLDTDFDLMLLKARKFLALGLYAIYVPEQFGGVNLTRAEKVELQEAFGYQGGAFAFLQVQAGTASWLIQQSDNTDYKAELLNGMVSGKISMGNCTYQLKSNHGRKLIGRRCKGGYCLSGQLQLASGYGLLNALLIGFHDDKEECIGVISFESVEGALSVSDCFDTISMRSIGTVALTFNNYFITDENILLRWPAGRFFSFYRRFPPFAYPLGVAKQALHLAQSSSQLAYDDLQAKYERQLNGLAVLKEQLVNLPQTLPDDTDYIDALCAKIMRASWSAVEFSILISGGRGLLSHHPLQRLYRELCIWFIPRAYPEVIADLTF